MKLELAKEVQACLPKGRTLFYYSKDDYAFLLLKKLSRNEPNIHKLKQSHARKLLEKPNVKTYLATCQDGKLRPETIPDGQFSGDCRAYRLSLDIWGSDTEYWHWNQVSRKGVSLVLQLNLNHTHHTHLSRCVDLEEYDPFKNYGHPAQNGTFPTLSWARLDFDFDTGEALIEELQTDLLREMRVVVTKAKAALEEKKLQFQCFGGLFDTQKIIHYWETYFSVYEKTWHEAMLTAAIKFLTDELGLKVIFYHTHESGKLLKRISKNLPPRSLYTTLPKQFCFQETNQIPELLKQEHNWNRRVKTISSPIRFFKMAV